ncbi:hypothetical protein [Pseudoalteromonas sp. NBT06-2]|nr:hypothetical protein [Pseudoalteromonas sp. NBT06-2]
MKLKLNKKKIKNLSKDNHALPAEMTPKIAGGSCCCPTKATCIQQGCKLN